MMSKGTGTLMTQTRQPLRSRHIHHDTTNRKSEENNQDTQNDGRLWHGRNIRCKTQQQERQTKYHGAQQSCHTLARYATVEQEKTTFHVKAIMGNVISVKNKTMPGTCESSKIPISACLACS